MKSWVRYGKGRLEFTVPDGSTVIQTPPVQPLADPRERIIEALDNPIGSEPLTKLAEKFADDAKVVVVISDITRPVPNQALLEPLLEKLEALTGKKPKVNFADWRPSDQKVYITDTSKLEKTLAWKIRTPVKEGIKKLAQWVKENEACFK